jgi:hypothetical protein
MLSNDQTGPRGPRFKVNFTSRVAFAKLEQLDRLNKLPVAAACWQHSTGRRRATLLNYV